MELSVLNSGNTESSKKIEVSDELFGREFNEDLAHQAVVAWFAGRRQGSKAQKSRSEVRGGGAKPWRQKGTGRARAGTITSPIWRTGGVTFAAKPRDHSKKLNKKMYRAAIRGIVSELIRQDRLTVIDKLEVASPKTKEFNKMLQKLGIEKGLFIANDANGDVYLASRNLPGVAVATTSDINPVALLQFDRIVITEQSLSALSEILA